MSIIKKCILLITFIIFLYVIWQLIILRINFKKEMNQSTIENFQEGLSLSTMFSSDQQKELTKMSSTTSITIKNMNETNNYLTLKDFCIKSSYNTALSGKYVSKDAISYVINRGVRYVDFEIFYLDVNSLNNITSKGVDFQPVVGYSTDPTLVQLNTLNVILLSDALSSCLNISNNSSNSKDPFIINLRIKSNNQEVYSSVAKCIDNTLYPNLYTDPNNTNLIATDMNGKSITRNVAIKITGDTVISDIMGKIIISLDTTYFPNYENAICDLSLNVSNVCKYSLSNYVNIENGSQSMYLSFYSYLIEKSTIIINKDGSTNIDNFYVAIPDSNYLNKNKNKNPNFGDWLLKFGIPVIPLQFYFNDSALEDYEIFFNDNKSAFVPLADSITYFKKKISL
jgi:hypothetical protein